MTQGKHLPSALRRAPCGARGLKLQAIISKTTIKSRAPCGARGLKSEFSLMSRRPGRRAPCGARGLKYVKHDKLPQGEQVAPHAGRVD